MTEIEIKAHVADPEKTEKSIASFARFQKHTKKSDVYWTRTEERDPQEKLNAGFAAAMAAFTFIAALAAAVCVIAGADRSIVILICLGAGMLVAATSVVSFRSARKASRAVPGENPAAAHRVKIRIREERDAETGDGGTVVTYKRKEIRGDIEVNDEKEFSLEGREDFEALIADLGFSPEIRKEKDTKSFSWTAPDGHAMTIELSLVAALGWFVELEILADEPDEGETARARTELLKALALAGIPDSAVETRYYTDMLAEAESRAGTPHRR
jgi:predicted adenylyl cyclase CyaB